MRPSDRFGLVAATAALVVLAALMPRSTDARPVYFDAFVTNYGFIEGDDLHACGVCHIRWDGTGARNLYGQSVEQQLYIGKTIQQSIADVESADPDADGFTSGDEISIHMTLPGYNCTNFQEAINAPVGYDTFITPGVPSCLEPLDIRVVPETVALATFVGEVQTIDVEVFNNGTDDDIIVSSYGLVTGDPDLSIVGTTAPITIPVGQSEILQVVYAPTGPAFINDTLRINSNDPDENPVDVALTAIAINQTLAPADLRAACFKQVNKAYRKYTKTHERVWGDCYIDEVAGIACDAGARDLRLENAELKLRASVGGDKDKACDPQGINPSNLGLQATCGGTCDSISLDSMDSYADCLVCRADAARDAQLTAAIGTIPPDLPLNTAGTPLAAACQDRLASTLVKSTLKIQSTLSKCELDNATAASPVDCSVEGAAKIQKSVDKANLAIEKCADTAGLAGCLFEAMPVATCLGDTALSTGQDLVNATFGLD